MLKVTGHPPFFVASTRTTERVEHRAGRPSRGLRKNRSELVTAQSAEDVGLPSAGSQSVRDLAQDLVARVVALEVV